MALPRGGSKTTSSLTVGGADCQNRGATSPSCERPEPRRHALELRRPVLTRFGEGNRHRVALHLHDAQERLAVEVAALGLHVNRDGRFVVSSV